MQHPEVFRGFSDRVNQGCLVILWCVRLATEAENNVFELAPPALSGGRYWQDCQIKQEELYV